MVIARRLTLSLVLLIFTETATAQFDVTYDRVLLPTASAREVPGQFGSRWLSRVSVLNRSQSSVWILGYDANCHFLPCFVSRTPNGVTFYPIVDDRFAVGGTILLVERAYSDEVEIHLRTQDLSRQAEAWGTEIPTVRERDLRSGPLTLLDVPLEGKFRENLRVYDFSSVPNAAALVRFYRTDSSLGSPITGQEPSPAKDVLLAELSVPLKTQGFTGFSAQSSFGYGELFDLSSLPQLSGASRLRIEVVSTTKEQKLWAFVSVTHNDTQHVTLVTPAARFVPFP